MSDETARLKRLLKSASGEQEDVELAILVEQHLGIKAEDVVKSLQCKLSGSRVRVVA